jgi:hypothetical protein
MPSRPAGCATHRVRRFTWPIAGNRDRTAALLETATAVAGFTVEEDADRLSTSSCGYRPRLRARRGRTTVRLGVGRLRVRMAAWWCGQVRLHCLIDVAVGLAGTDTIEDAVTG